MGTGSAGEVMNGNAFVGCVKNREIQAMAYGLDFVDGKDKGE